MFGSNLVTSSLFQFSACKISSLSYQLVAWLTKILVPRFNHPTVNQQVLCHMPSHRHQTALPCPSTSTSGTCRMPRWLSSLVCVPQTHISCLPVPETLTYCTEPENRWHDAAACLYLNLPLPLHVLAHPSCDPGWEYVLSAANREKTRPVAAERCSCTTLSRAVIHH